MGFEPIQHKPRSADAFAASGKERCPKLSERGSGGWIMKVALVLLQSMSVLVKLCFGKMCPSNTLLEPFPLLLSMGENPGCPRV